MKNELRTKDRLRLRLWNDLTLIVFLRFDVNYIINFYEFLTHFTSKYLRPSGLIAKLSCKLETISLSYA